MEERTVATGAIHPGKSGPLGEVLFGGELTRNEACAPSPSCAALRIDHGEGRVVPTGLLGALCLTIVIECIISQISGTTRPRSRIVLSWQSVRQAASGSEGNVDLLCFGDSLVKLAILPRVLEERLGCSVYNLAVLGGQAPTSYFLLRRVLEQGHRPKAVVVDFSALLLAMDPRVNVAGWSILTDAWERMALAWRALDPKLAVLMAVQGILPSWSRRDAVRSAIILDSPGAADGADSPDDLRVFVRNWRLNRGAQVAPREFVPIEGALPQPCEEGTWKWRPNPTHVNYVEQFLRLAESHRIPVFWVLTPAMSTWRARNQRSGTITSYERFVRRCSDCFPGLTVLDGQYLGWSTWAFRDPIHLNRDGALSLSLIVAESIAPRLDGSPSPSRWIELEGVDEPPSGRFQHLLEDLDQSRLVVHDSVRGDGGSKELRP
jgi:hypothetical protein